ncbi:MAG TPA: sigma-70 family RNA polymerase sigma factor [Clostridiales bacterium]|jgi:RNA polymerase sigma factor (sigma-70 family)|nr:sigma-70 family RNA polymerase sigma factor [Clostridiales bacterium]
MKGGIDAVPDIRYDTPLSKYIDYQRYLTESASDNREVLDCMCRNLSRAIRSELTPNQFRVIAFYYVEGMKMSEIAELLGVNVSTVSRTIKRGRARLQRCLKYSAPEFFREK